jgi:hypothetical protein
MSENLGKTAVLPVLPMIKSLACKQLTSYSPKRVVTTVYIEITVVTTRLGE